MAFRRPSSRLSGLRRCFAVVHAHYRDNRAINDRLRLMRELFLDRAEWVLSGSLDGWGDPLIPPFDLVVFVFVPTEVRLQRLRKREARRFRRRCRSCGRLWRHQELEEFIDWASRYDNDARVGRNLKRHEAWLAGLPCPVVEVDGTRATRELVEDVLAAIGKRVDDA